MARGMEVLARTWACGRRIVGWRNGPGSEVGARDETLDAGKFEVRSHCAPGEEYHAEADEDENALYYRDPFLEDEFVREDAKLS